MHTGSVTLRTASLACLVAAAAVLSGCGGSGGDETGGGGAVARLDLVATDMNGEPTANGIFSVGSSVAWFGILDPTNNSVTTQPFPVLPVDPNTGLPSVTLPAGANSSVTAAEFPAPAGTGARQDFLRLRFNAPLRSSSLRDPSLLAPDGVQIIRIDPMTGVTTPVLIGFDRDGVLDPSNAWDVAADRAPEILRIYRDADADINTPDVFEPGNYLVTVTDRLLSTTGLQIAPNVSDTRPILSFSVGPDTAPLIMATGGSSLQGASLPTRTNAAPLDTEIILNFNKAIDFPSLVGAGNLTTLDAFITQPINFPPFTNANAVNGNVAACGPAALELARGVYLNGGSLYVGLRIPGAMVAGGLVPQDVPANLGFVVYMADPVYNPTQVRIRFVNTTNLVGVNGAGMFQNYASNPARLPIPTQDPTAVQLAQLEGRAVPVLQVPPQQQVPGSLPAYTPGANFTSDPMSLRAEVVIPSSTMGATFTNPTGLICTNPPMMAPVSTFTARPSPISGAGQPFQAGAPANTAVPGDFNLFFGYRAGSGLARNATPPDAVLVGAQRAPNVGLASINNAGIMTPAGTDNSVPAIVGGQVTYLSELSPNRLSDTQILGTPIDMEIARHINPAARFGNEPRQSLNPPPGVPDSQNGTTAIGLLQLVAPTNPPTPANQQPLGMYLYVVDGDNEDVRVFSSYDFQRLAVINGVRSPAGLGISPDLNSVFVSNRREGTLQRIDAVPNSSSFNTVIDETTVGFGPTKVSVQPGSNDIFVANEGGNTVSIVALSNFRERLVLNDAALIAPSSINVTYGDYGAGRTNTWWAFITARGTDTMIIYESSSPAVQENGPDGLIKASTQDGLAGPVNAAWNHEDAIDNLPINAGAAAYNGTTAPGIFVANSRTPTVVESVIARFTLGPAIGFPGPPGRRELEARKTLSTQLIPGGVGNSLVGQSPSDVSVESLSGIRAPYSAGGRQPMTPAALPQNKAQGAQGWGSGGSYSLVVLAAYPGAGQVGVWDAQGSNLRAVVNVPGVSFLHSYYDQ